MSDIPVVMPTSRVRMSLELEAKFPGRLGLLLSADDGWSNPRGLPYAIDNGRYAVWAKGKSWGEGNFLRLLERAAEHEYPPLWVVVPDVPADAVNTIDWWHSWAPRMPPWPLACAVQDGMTSECVRRLEPKPDVIFVGGTTAFKWRTVYQWTKMFSRVHVGRVNTGGLLWRCHRAGAESSDGTGWWHHKQKRQLIEYLRRSTLGLPEHDDFLIDW